MTGIDIFAWVVLLVIVATVLIAVAVLGGLPGKIARQRQHPQAEAIQVAGWVALIFGFALWPVILVWSYLRPIAGIGGAEGDDTNGRIAELEARIAALESATPGGQAP